MSMQRTRTARLRSLPRRSMATRLLSSNCSLFPGSMSTQRTRTDGLRSAPRQSMAAWLLSSCCSRRARPSSTQQTRATSSAFAQTSPRPRLRFFSPSTSALTGGVLTPQNFPAPSFSNASCSPLGGAGLLRGSSRCSRARFAFVWPRC
eukprot:Amastigsp_a841954_10.p5 type:complete len:148 gc:universal Amastigsp_a841954_10:890-447(-)